MLISYTGTTSSRRYVRVISEAVRVRVLIACLAAIVGGLILLVHMGAGGFSVDEKKKTY